MKMTRAIRMMEPNDETRPIMTPVNADEGGDDETAVMMKGRTLAAADSCASVCVCVGVCVCLCWPSALVMRVRKISRGVRACVCVSKCKVGISIGSSEFEQTERRHRRERSIREKCKIARRKKKQEEF